MGNRGGKGKSDKETMLVLKRKRTFHSVKLFHIVAATQGNTTNIYNHHKLQYKLVIRDKGTTSENTSHQTAQMFITQTFYGPLSWPLDYHWHKKINSITYYLANDITPINWIENEEFKTMIKTIDKGHTLFLFFYFSLHYIST